MFGGLIGKNKAWEISFLYFIREWSDGVDWFNFEINSDWYEGDHNPQFHIRLILINLMVVEFSFYDVRHTNNR